MSLPPATFAAIAPPADGLVLAFTSARRRRNSKAAVSAFGGAVAIASMLSFLAPPGQTLVQAPTQPATGGLLTGLTDAPRHGAPAPQVRSPVARAAALLTDVIGAQAAPATAMRRVVVRPPVALTDPCSDDRTLACATLPYVVNGEPSMRVKVCPTAVSVTVGYDAPHGGPRRSDSQTIDVGDGCSS